MAHVGSDRSSQRDGIHVRDPVTDEELQVLVRAFSILLKIDQNVNNNYGEAQEESNSYLVASPKKSV